MLIDRYLIAEILRPAAMGIGLFLLIFVGFSLSKNLARAADGLLDPVTAVLLVGLVTLKAMEVILPTALFFSVLSVMGRLYQNGEIAVLNAAGVSNARLMSTIGGLALVAAVAAGILSIYGRPWAYSNIYRLEAEALSQLDGASLSAGQFISLESESYTFIADARSSEARIHQGVFLYRTHSIGDGAPVKELIRADQARLPRFDPQTPALMTFHDGYSYLLDPEAAGADVAVRFKEMEVVLSAIEEKRAEYKRKAQSTESLLDSGRPRDIAEVQWRLSNPLAAFLLTMLALPLARSRPRESHLRNNIMAFFVYLLLFGEVAVMRSLLEDEKIPARPGLWIAYLPPLVLLLLLVVPIRRWWARWCQRGDQGRGAH